MFIYYILYICTYYNTTIYKPIQLISIKHLYYILLAHFGICRHRSNVWRCLVLIHVFYFRPRCWVAYDPPRRWILLWERC